MKRLMIKAAFTAVFCFPVLATAMSIQYFGLRGSPPIRSTENVSACFLGNIEKIQSAITDDLKAQMAVKNMSASDIAERYKNQFKTVSLDMICQFKAAKLGVERLPAIIINHQYVIYGQKNIDLAVREYQAYREREHVE